MGCLLPGCAYIAQAAQGQFRLLAGRVPIEEALETVDFTDEERELLGWVPRIKSFGEAVVGLSATPNYETINPDFDDVVWNVSACARDRFDSHIYRYPIVGALPYIGYFDKADALEEQKKLQALGWETWVRPAGAYSTLGWFKDPLWRSMLKWDLDRLANTVLHELAHSTLWIKGEGRFNESFASFVGDEAERRFLESIRREAPHVWTKHIDREADQAAYRLFMHRLVRRLEALYDAGLSTREVLERKQQLMDQARRDYGQMEWRLAGYEAALGPDVVLNNARLGQFRVYNTGSEVFDEALERFGGDLSAFVEASRDLPSLVGRGSNRKDPYDLLKALKPPQ